MSQLVFVFGTLKQGFPNHHYIAQQTLVGDFETEQAYPLYLVGDRYSPWMMDQAGSGTPVTGQVYKIDKETLSVLDELERTGFKDGYTRQQIAVRKLNATTRLQVNCYLKPAWQLSAQAIRCGPLPSYLPEHARLYRSRKSRA